MILQAISALVTALIISFLSGWKLTFVVSCFIPLLLLAGKLQGRKQSKAGQSNSKDSFVEQGGQVERNIIMISFYFDSIKFLISSML